MGRSVNLSLLMVKLQTAEGSAATPDGTNDTMWVENFSVTHNTNMVERGPLLRHYVGAVGRDQGTETISFSFDVPLDGSGAAGTAAMHDDLLRACRAAATVSAGSRVEYNPISSANEFATVYFEESGIRYSTIDTIGVVGFKINVGSRAMLHFEMTGVKVAAAAQTLSTGVFTSWRPGLMVTDANTGDFLLGPSITTGTLSSGTGYPCRGVEVESGDALAFTELLGGNKMDYGDRGSTLKATLDLTVAQEETFRTALRAGTETTFGITHGTTAGRIIVLYGPKAKPADIQPAEVNKRRLFDVSYDLLPSSGNDEWKLVVR